MILVVDDNALVADNIVEYLHLQWFEAKAEYDGEKAFETIERSMDTGTKIDLIILDRMMPRLDGMGLLRLLRSRKRDIPIVFLTALGKPIDTLEWLEAGAIEYLVKPVELKELWLRIKNILGHCGEPNRRWGWTKWNGMDLQSTTPSEMDQTSEEIWVGDVSIAIESQIVRRNGRIVHLAPKEFQILKILVENRGHVVSPEVLFEKVWFDHGSKFSEYTTTITVHMAYLRKKLGSSIIRTVKLSGYIIDLPK